MQSGAAPPLEVNGAHRIRVPHVADPRFRNATNIPVMAGLDLAWTRQSTARRVLPRPSPLGLGRRFVLQDIDDFGHPAAASALEFGAELIIAGRPRVSFAYLCGGGACGAGPSLERPGIADSGRSLPRIRRAEDRTRVRRRCGRPGRRNFLLLADRLLADDLFGDIWNRIEIDRHAGGRARSGTRWNTAGNGLGGRASDQDGGCKGGRGPSSHQSLPQASATNPTNNFCRSSERCPYPLLNSRMTLSH
jgi:hypothetical protein